MASSDLIKGFRDFILRGNVVDLAVAVVIGAAFKEVIDAFSAGILNPIVSAIFGKPNLDSVGTFTINHSRFSIGVVLTAIIVFLEIAAAVYFFVVLPVNTLMARFASGEVEAAAPDPQTELLGENRDLLAAGAVPAKATRTRPTT